MASRIQNLIIGLGIDAQSDISHASTTFARFMKLNASATTPQLVTENDAAEIGKGHEFVNSTYMSHVNVANTIEKYATSEFCTWAIAYALGDVTTYTPPVGPATTPYTYVIKPIDPTATLELPLFSIVEQLPEGGDAAMDNIFLGCAMESFTYSFNYGPGRASSKMNCEWVGSGLLTTPSAVVVPAVVTEHNMLSAGMSLTVNGVDYVGAKTLLSGSVSWKNNLLLNQGFYPGSGINADGFATRGRMEIGVRQVGFSFVIRAIHGSPEFAMLKAPNTSPSGGTAVLKIQNTPANDNDSVQFTFEKVLYEAIQIGEADGISTFQLTTAPAYHATNGVLSVTCKSALGDIAQ